MIACWDCRNLQHFLQTSGKGDARSIEITPKGARPGPWDMPDERPSGLWCQTCSGPAEGDVEELSLVDERIPFMSPSEFDAAQLLDELIDLRPDAQWSRFLLPATDPVFGELTADIHPAVAAALSRTNRLPLFSHQVEAIEAALSGEQMVLATPAGSGKSLGFIVPVLHALVSDSRATAILVFPLRALANDQLDGLSRLDAGESTWINSTSFDLDLGDGTPTIRVAKVDGATPEHEKVEARRSARLVITTPDTLHMSILRMSNRSYRDGTSWFRLLGGLSHVVLDEIHSYQGVFGSNVGNVLRRLRRTAAHHGGHPRFLTASATIGNPEELAERLTGTTPFRVIDRDGSARRARHVLICNPPLRRDTVGTDPPHEGDGDSGRIAPQTIAISLVSESALVSENHLPVRTIVFCRSRNAVFQLAKRIRLSLTESHHSELAPTVAPYAATFLADDRVEAEGQLRDGSTLAIVSTSALELGIDIPDLSLALLEGYPGQISSFRQRAGRVGRSGEGVAVLIVGDDPLQQHLARDPEALRGLLESRAESVVVNPDAPAIARRYGLLPAQEEFGGISFEDSTYFGESVNRWLADVSGAPAITVRGVPYWRVEEVEDAYFPIRSATAGASYTVLQVRGREREAIGVIDESSAPRDAFVPAIWTGPNGDLFRVVGFDKKLGEIYCEGPVDVGHQTRGMTVDRVEVTSAHRPVRDLPGAKLEYGVLEITRQVFSYREQHFSGADVRRQVEKGWDPVEFITDGLRLSLGAAAPESPAAEDDLRALEHVLLSVAPAIVACDPFDLEASTDKSSVFVYDAFGGGLRTSEVLYDRVEEWLELARSVIASCDCASGCPGCVMLSRRPDGNQGLSKVGALRLLEDLTLQSEPS